jgi:copper oxidase (laccase) domain-containing protein
LYDPESGALGLAHSGWKGTGIALKALRLMEERWGVRPEGVAAVLGPCICPRCYRVDGERARAFEAEFGGPGGTYPLGPLSGPLSGPGGQRPGETAGGFFIDLQAANARLLAGAGVRNIAFCGDCTFTDERLGSFRREGAAYTRMAALAGRF